MSGRESVKPGGTAEVIAFVPANELEQRLFYLQSAGKENYYV
jgi:hypothetical protein